MELKARFYSEFFEKLNDADKATFLDGTDSDPFETFSTKYVFAKDDPEQDLSVMIETMKPYFKK